MHKQIKYGKLTAIRATNDRYFNDVVWEFQCECGNICYRSLSHVKRNLRLGYEVGCGKCTTSAQSNSSRINALKMSENGGNVGLLKRDDAYITNALGVKGVSYDKSRNKYKAQITYKKKHYMLGRFDTVEEAKQAYDNKRNELLEQ